MSIQALTQQLIDSGIAPNEAKKEIEMFLEYFYGYTPKDELLGKVISDFSILEEKVKERINNKTPIQYIIAEAWFMGDFYKVTPDVLIPRDETEILVKKAIEIINNEGFEDVLDIGTGSGCIACAVAKNTNATVLGVDISSDALRIALDNVTKLGINNKAVFRKSDLFDKIREEEKFDMIISNPPYIPFGTKLSNAVMHEPKEALFAEENGLAIYRKIIELAPLYLLDGGYLMFELGINESNDVKQMMSKRFKNIVIEKALKGENIIGKSKTGTGKTHAFILPILDSLSPVDVIDAVIISPTRELAMQIFDEINKIIEFSPEKIDVRLYVGGTNRDSEIERLKKSQPQIVIGTIGKIKDLAIKENVLKIHTARFVVIDEADMVFEMSEMNEVDSVFGKFINPQIMTFSATIPQNLMVFLNKYLDNLFLPSQHAILIDISH